MTVVDGELRVDTDATAGLDRPIRIYATPNPLLPNASETVYRVSTPLRFLEVQGFEVRLSFEDVTHLADIEWCDVLYTKNRLCVPRKAFAIIRNALRAGHKALVTDFDDDLWNLRPWNPTANYYYGAGSLVYYEDIIRAANLVTVSREPLKRRIRCFGRPVCVIPNVFDPDMWPLPVFTGSPRRDSVSVGVYGGPTHYMDWRILRDIIPRVARRYPAVRFLFGGNKPSYIDELGLDDRIELIPGVPYPELATLIRRFDVNLCPLLDDLFNISKSPIKWQEAALSGVPSVVSPTLYGEYVQDGKTAFVARTVDEWVDRIGRLIEDPDLRQRMALEARANVLANFSIQHHIETWADVFRTAFTMAQGQGQHRHSLIGIGG